MSDVPRYWRTVRHLKAVQLYGRVLFKVVRPTPDLRPAPPLRQPTGAWTPPPLRAPSLVGPARLRLLDQEHEVRTPADWSRHDVSRLWLYNLHYFDDLASVATPERRSWQSALVSRWITQNPPATGPGWEPYPTSLRLVNWIKWTKGGAELPPAAIQSMAVQARWLARRIEYHLQANHLFVNAKALLVAGLYFDGPEADGWRATALRILAEQLPEQVHRDGGHFEASPMYHALMLEDLLDLINCTAHTPGVIAEPVVAAWRESASRMQSWLDALTHPDGDIAFFNDAALGIAPPAAELRAYGAALRLEVVASRLGDSGYVRAERGPAVLLMDVAPVGPDYQPGHAHADTLSFELSLDGTRLIVNSGTSTYDVGPQRALERSTAAHSTVTINGVDSSEVWGGFRVGRRARVQPLARDDEAPVFLLSASHDGYRAEPASPVHARTWQLDAAGLVVTDRCTRARTAVARYFLHPSIRSGPGGELLLPHGRRCRWSVTGGAAVIREAQWHPGFNRTAASLCLEITVMGDECRTTFAW